MCADQSDPEAFVKTVEQTLEHFQDVSWLGAKSPLSAPYYLGRLLQDEPDADSPAGRVRVLQHALRQAANELDDEHRRLLNISYFERDRHLNNTGVMLQLNETKPTYYRRRKESIYALAIAFNKRVQPPLRPEKPAVRRMVGRETAKSDILSSLCAGKSVAVIGPGGIGKTTFGISLAEAWGWSRSFWFTVRPGLNDDLSSLVFAIGYFLHGMGSSHLWRQLVADEGAVELRRVLGLLRYDLAQLQSNPPLLCIDEVELLKSENGWHSAVLELLRELRDVTPLILIGQRQVMEVQHPLSLAGLSDSEMQDLLDIIGLGALDADNLQRLLSVVRGNPLLAEMIALLHRAGESVESALSSLGQFSSLQVLLERLWKRMNAEEQHLLMLIAVFRTPTPVDAFQQPKTSWEPALSQLLAREVVVTDRSGNIIPVSHLSDFVVDQIDPGIRGSLHRYAAIIHATRADYTEAAYHFVEAGESELAIALWLSHQEEETERGRASQARVIFESVDERLLSSDEDRRALALLRGRQLLVAGETKAAITALTSSHWHSSHLARPYVEQLLGDAHRNLGQFEAAEGRYRAALFSLVGSHDLRRVFVHGKLGYLFTTHMRDLNRARHEGLQMQFATLSFRGYVEEESGNFSVARDYYQQALDIALQLGNRLADQSRIYSDLGRLAWRQGDAKASIAYLEQSKKSDHVLGESVSALVDHLNLSAAYIIAGDYRKSLEQVHASLPLAEAVNNTYLAAGLASNGAEACYYLDDIENAERFATQSLRYEEGSHRPYALTVLGRVRQKQTQFSVAVDILQTAIESARDNSDTYAEAPALLYLGEVLCELNESSSAKQALAKAIGLFQQLGLENERVRVEQILARLP